MTNFTSVLESVHGKASAAAAVREATPGDERHRDNSFTVFIHITHCH